MINLVRKMKKKSPKWNKSDYVGLRAHLARQDWDRMMEGKTVEEAWKILKDGIDH